MSTVSRNKKVIENPFRKYLPMWTRFRLDLSSIGRTGLYYVMLNGEYIVAEPDKYAVLVTGTRCNQCAFEKWCQSNHQYKDLLPRCVSIDNEELVFHKA